MNPPFQPLDGIRIVEVTSSLAGPTCTEVLSALGADVIKIEPPEGDHARGWGPPFSNTDSALFLSANAGKRSLTLNLHDDNSRQTLDRLIADADVLVVALRPGAAERAGLDPAVVCNRHPRLVYCTIQAFGSRGPLSRDPGYDPMMQAFAGILSVTGERDGRGVRAGVSIVDFATGLWSALGIVAAVRERDRTNRGRAIELSLLETALWLLGPQIAGYMVTGEAPGRHGTAFPLIAPYEVFPTADGELMIAAANDRLYRALADCLALPDDPRFVTNAQRVRHRAPLAALISEKLLTDTTATWLDRIRSAGVPAAPVNDLAEALAHEQTHALGVLQTLGNVKIVAPPLTVDGHRLLHRSPPPTVGEHSNEIAAQLRVEDDEARSAGDLVARTAEIPRGVLDRSAQGPSEQTKLAPMSDE